jgi:ABC-type nickel/cobalt efflux system permease component RcnA
MASPFCHPGNPTSMHSHTHELSLGLSFFLGALHALEPGHGKTAMFVYLLDGRRSFWHPIVIGLSTAVSHSVSLFAIALGVHLAHHVIAGDHDHEGQVSEWLQWISAMLVVAVGGYLMVQTLRGRKSACCGHTHHHVQTDHHHSGHHHHQGAACDREHCNHDHSTDADQHSSPLIQLGGITAAAISVSEDTADANDAAITTAVRKPEVSGSFRTTAILGLAVGLLPCPTAMAAYFAGLSSGSPAAAWLIIGLFSAGIACSLSLTGIVLQYFGGRFSRRSAALSQLPWSLIRSALILGIGLVYVIRLISASPT